MRIVLVIDQFDDENNGTTISAKRFANVLEEHGNQVTIVSTGKPVSNKYVVKDLYLPIVTEVARSQGMKFAWPDKAILKKAMLEADIVHFLMPFPLSIAGLKIAKDLKIPHTAAFHVQPENITYTIKLGTNQFINRKIYSAYRNIFYNQFTHIHCPSNFIANQLKENGYTAKLHVISNGIDPAFAYRKIEKSSFFQDKFVITMVGRFSNEKRQDVLIHAINQSKYRNKIQLVLAGKGPKKHALTRLGHILPHAPILNFYTKEDLLDILSMSDLYVHAADAEIEAISCMEAFATGLVPIIANSQKSATPQFAIDNRSLFEAGNSSDLAQKIDYWIEHSEERKKMEIEYSNLGKKYNISQCVYQIEEMFREAMKEYE